MELKTKFELGDILCTEDAQYMGKVIKITILQQVDGKNTVTTIHYTCRANANSCNIPEENAIRLVME